MDIPHLSAQGCYIELKPLEFVGSSHFDLCTFPITVRHAAGHELMRVQASLMPTDFNTPADAEAGTYEIRIREWRVLCVDKFKEAIYALDAYKGML